MPIISAIGLRLYFFTAASLATSTKEAPSFMPDALPAVTVPSLLKAGFSLASFSRSGVRWGYSSVSKTVSPFVEWIVIGTISFLNLPASIAAIAFCWEANANSSCCALVILNFAAIFSAVIPMWIFARASVKAS